MRAPGSSGDVGLQALLLQRAVEAFFTREAELLDARRYREWLALLSDDVRYWAPLHRNFPFGQPQEEHTREGRDLSWFDEGRFELEQRVEQILTGKHWAEEPASRTSHLVTNVAVCEADARHVETRCRFLVYRNRTEAEWDLFVGKREDRLRRHGDRGHDFRIARRRIYLDQNVLLAKNLTLFF